MPSRRLSKAWFLILLLAGASCSLPGTAPAPQENLSPPFADRILSRSEGINALRIERMKALVEISLSLRGRSLLDRASGVVYLEAPDKIRIRAYRMGVPVFDLLQRSDLIRSRPALNTPQETEAVKTLLQAFQWWQNDPSATWTVSPDAYVLKTRSQTIWFDRNWLTPLRQRIRTAPEPVAIEYGGRTALGPRQYLPAWLEARTSSYDLHVTISKMSADAFEDPALFEWAED